MLFPFFFKRFFNYFLIIFLLLTLVLGVSNLLLKLAMIPSLYTLCFALYGMIPLMGVYVFPLATGLAVQMVIGSLMIDDELLVLQFFKSARLVLQESIFVFAVTLSLVYVPLTFFWAPESYWVGKKMLLNMAKRQLYQLEAQKFHTPYPGVTFYFKQKEVDKVWPTFFSIFLSFTGDKGERFLFTAQQGCVKNNCLLLNNGSVHTMQNDQHYYATFQESELNLEKLFALEKEVMGRHIKSMPLDDLYHHRAENKDAWFEFHKRISQCLWQLLFPFLALWGIFILRRRKVTLLTSIIFNGILFLGFYVTLAMAQVVMLRWLTLCFLYVPVIICSGVLWWLYKKRMF